MKKLMWIIILLLLSSILTAQQITFNKVYDFNQTHGRADAIIETSNGYVLTGYGESPSFYFGIKTLAIDFEGNVLWEHILHQDSFSFNTGRPGSMMLSKDSHIVIMGCSTFADVNNINYDAVALKLNQNGDTLFYNSYGGTENDFFYSVAEDVEGDYLFFGSSSSYTNNNPQLSYWYLIKTDTAGNLIRQNNYSQFRNGSGDKVHALPSGDILLSGTGQWMSQQPKKGWAVLTDSTGTMKDYWHLSGGEICSANIMPSKYGGYYYWGCRDTNYVSPPHPLFYEGFPYVAKYDTAMTEIWRKEFRPKEEDIHRYFTGDAGYISMVRELDDEESYIMCGEIKDSINQSLGWIVKFDKTGEIVWERKYYYPKINGGYNSLLTDVRQTTGGGFIAGGYAFPTNRTAYWYLKLDSMGCLSAIDCGVSPVVGVANKVLNESMIKVYPNPATNEITIQSEKYHIEHITLYDITGKAQDIAIEERKEAAIIMNIDKLTTGIYFCHITLANGQMVVRKVVKE
jgi:hypothetical protein